MRRVIASLVLAATLTWALFSLRELSPRSADSTEISGFVERPVPVWYLRWPLTHLAAQGLHTATGLPGADCLALLSSVAGALFILSVAAVSRRSPRVLIVLVSSATLTLNGHVEVYAWPLLALLLLLLLGPRHLEGRMALWPLAAVWALGSLMHMLVVFYTPALVWLAWTARRRAAARGVGRRGLDRQLLPAMLIALAFLAVISLAPLVLQAGGLDNDVERVVPLTMPETPRSSNQVTLFSPRHLGQIAIFLALSCPLGAPLVLLRIRRIWRDGTVRFTSVAAACGLLFLVLWHPDMGWRGDWDLFAHPGLVINVLAWRLWEKR